MHCLHCDTDCIARPAFAEPEGGRKVPASRSKRPNPRGTLQAATCHQQPMQAADDRFPGSTNPHGARLGVTDRAIILPRCTLHFTSGLGQNPLLPRRNIDGRFTSISRHTMAHRLSGRGIGVTRTSDRVQRTCSCSNRRNFDLTRSRGRLFNLLLTFFADPKPFIWTKSAGEILKKVGRAKQALESQH